jgi:RNA polymerase sigma-70 factor (ECF subfamily)
VTTEGRGRLPEKYDETMFSRDLTVTEIERLDRIAAEAVETLQMNEDAFRSFYDRTARSVWAYLARVTGDRALADDLLQETYYRFLRADRAFDSDAHRRHYLFRIATNLARDRHRAGGAAVHVPISDDQGGHALVDGHDLVSDTQRRTDLARAMSQISTRDRQLLWLAYAQGSSHEEISEMLGLRKGSIKILLFRARRRLAAALRALGGVDR